VYVFLGSAHALVNIVWQVVSCMEEECPMFDETFVDVLAMASLFLGVLFALFVVVMFMDQLFLIWDNTSTIDNLKKQSGLISDAVLD